jgi:hypothetical protein
MSSRGLVTSTRGVRVLTTGSDPVQRDPPGRLAYVNELVDKKDAADIVNRCADATRHETVAACSTP